MNEIEICLQNKITIANGVIQPIILQAILNLYQQGNHQMTAKMVQNHCLILDNITLWNQRIPAICNSMRNATECGGIIIGEDRNFNDFTIAFNGNDTNLFAPTPKSKSTNEKDKSTSKAKSPQAKNNTNQAKIILSKNFKVVMICAGQKNNSFFTAYPIEKFVDNPSNNFEHHPDDIKENSETTWRDYLIDNQNDKNLLEAYRLYVPRTLPNVYLESHNRFMANLYILSAGWGLVRANYRLPKYDITFSKATNVSLNARRNFNTTQYQDFNQLDKNDDNDIVFIGSPDYIPLFIHLTENLKNRKIIYWKKKNTPNTYPLPNNSFLYRFYLTTTNTNWYYELARDFCSGLIP
ncbi:hypothetical protein [Flavobacterium sp. RSSB_23]|uniref:hypothetical protein n=1 Tax=Flavobacterium sp. RSSB_23 TaxID=3447668 RepID=UPI003F2ACD4B